MDFSGGGRPPTPDTLDHLLVEAAIQCPEGDALTGDFGSLSYAELLIRAQNIAVVLKRHGVGPGHFVGIAMEQSAVMVTAIVGVILAGAAYVPLGETLLQPAALRRVRDARVSYILCDGSLATKSGKTTCEEWRGFGTVLDASRMEQETMPSSTEIRFTATPPGSPAALFLSNTPRAESVRVSHRSIGRLVSSSRLLPFRAEETFLLHASTTTRPALLELWGSLLHGATLALSPMQPLSSTAFAAWVQRHSVSVLCLSVARIHQLADQAPEVFAKLRYLLIESDGKNGSMPPSRVEWLQQQYPALQIINTYGTPRTAGCATAYRVPADYQAQSDLPIGMPIEGSQVFILDQHLHPSRTGELGQLAFMGDCVGVTGEPEVAPKSFLSDGSSRFDGGLYLTGERARLRADGLLELHGHAEPHLVTDTRMRAFDAIDVEAMVAGQKHIREAAVIEGVDRSGKHQLVAYVAVDGSQPAGSEQLERTLKGMLPQAAMPDAVRFVENLPLDSGGSIDHAALEQRWKKENERSPQPEHTHQQTLDLVRSLWLRLLRRANVGYEEDFYEAGGTTVQMIRMHAELNRKFPGAITMRQLSVLTTIRGIYEHLVQYASEGRPGKLEKWGA